MGVPFPISVSILFSLAVSMGRLRRYVRIVPRAVARSTGSASLQRSFLAVGEAEVSARERADGVPSVGIAPSPILEMRPSSAQRHAAQDHARDQGRILAVFVLLDLFLLLH